MAKKVRRKKQLQATFPEVKDTTDFGTPEMANQGVIVDDISGEKKTRSRNLTQVPLDYYLVMGWISERLHRAGQEYYRLWYYGSEERMRLTPMYNDMPKGEGDAEQMHIMKQRFREAGEAITGGLVSKLAAYNICCMGEWSDYLQGVVGKNRRMDILRKALTDLAEHFKF